MSRHRSAQRYWDAYEATLEPPADAAARNLARDSAQFFGWSVAISLVAGITGLFVSFYASTATGATIVLAAMAIYLLTLLRRPAS